MEHDEISTKKKSNKEKILFAAIDLFAQNGYNGVTMRDLADRVQIKAASIYNHYAGKEELLEAIVDYFRVHLQAEAYPSRETMLSLDAGSFLRGSIAAPERFFAVPVNAMIGQIFLREQFHNTLIRRVLLEELIIKPRGVYAAYFERLMDAGKMRRMDPVEAAKEYHAFFIYLFYENSLQLGSGQLDPETVRREQEGHVRRFLEQYCL